MSWVMFIDMYTDWKNVELYRKGKSFIAWTKDSKPKFADIHISLHNKK